MRTIQHRRVGNFHFNGRTFEEIMLDPEITPEKRVRTRVRSFEEALWQSIQTLPEGFPDYPKNAHIKHLLDELRWFFGKMERPKLKIFSTLYKALDLEGVDCFFYYRGRIVTIDLTTKEKKPRYKASLILPDSILGWADRQLYDCAEEIANLLIGSNDSLVNSKSAITLSVELAMKINNKYPLGY